MVTGWAGVALGPRDPHEGGVQDWLVYCGGHENPLPGPGWGASGLGQPSEVWDKSLLPGPQAMSVC